jgi:uncharacterized protein
VIALLDVNVLVALVLPTHEHHAIARQWFETDAEADGWATCTVSELGAIRICAYFGVAPKDTADTLTVLRRTGLRHTWWTDVPPGLLPDVRLATARNQVTDRYLLGLARRRGGRIATLDRGLATAGGSDVICLLP